MHTLRVLLALGPLALSFLRDHRRWLLWGGRVARTAEFHRRRADRLVRTIVRLGPSFVKISQVFATRADLLPEPYLGALGTLVDQVPPMPFEQVEATIRAAYGRGVDEVFERFDREPVAAASLAQVHEARWRSETVAVKVLRPGVELQVEADVTAARRILTWLDRVWGHPHIRRELTALAAFEVRVREEVNFEQEAAYAIAIRRNFAGSTRVVIPRVHDEMTRRRVLVMEFLEGIRVDRLDPAHVDVKHVVQTLVELYIQMELIDGLFHADPHPGNVLLAPDGRIVLLDFGAVVRVPLEMRRALVHTAIAAIRRDAEAVAQGFTDLGLVPPGTDRTQLQWISEVLIRHAYSRTTARERIDKLLAEKVMQALFDSPVTLTEEAVYFARAAALIEGIGTRYDPYFQIVPVASPVVIRMRTRILRSLGEEVTPTVEEMATVAGYALGRAAKWVRDLVQQARSRVAGNGAVRRVAEAARLVPLLLAAATLAACARPATQVTAVTPAPVRPPLTASDVRCDSCPPVQAHAELSRALEARISELRARGGACQAYGDVLARAYASGQITLRPFMWRVNGNLAAGAARPTGELATAVDIDSLNVGTRSLDEVIRSIEHEAAHVAFELPSRDPGSETAVNERVHACRPGGREQAAALLLR